MKASQFCNQEILFKNPCSHIWINPYIHFPASASWAHRSAYLLFPEGFLEK